MRIMRIKYKAIKLTVKYPIKLNNPLFNAESIVNLRDVYDLGLAATYFITINVEKKLYKK